MNKDTSPTEMINIPLNTMFLRENVLLINKWQQDYRPGVKSLTGKTVLPEKMNIAPCSLQTVSAVNPEVAAIMSDVVKCMRDRFDHNGFPLPYFLECSVKEADYTRTRASDNVVLFGKYARCNFKPLPGGVPAISSLSVYTLGLKFLFPELWTVTDAHGNLLHYLYMGTARQWWFPLTLPGNLALYNEVVNTLTRFNLDPEDTSSLKVIESETELNDRIAKLSGMYRPGLI